MQVADSPKISIVIVVLNAAETINAAILSVLNQDYPNYELVISDGLSTDGTIQIIEKYVDRITLFRSEKDIGIYDAMNKSLKRCTGDWIYFLGADDTLYNNQVLSSIFSVPYEQHQILYGNAYYISRKQVRFGKVSSYMMSKHNINHQTIFYPKDLFKHYTYDLKFRVVADYYLNLQLYFNSTYHFKFIDLIIANFNDLGTSGTYGDPMFDSIKESLARQLFPTKVYIFYRARRLFNIIRARIKRKA